MLSLSPVEAFLSLLAPVWCEDLPDLNRKTTAALVVSRLGIEVALKALGFDLNSPRLSL